MQRLANAGPKFHKRFIKHCIDYFDSVLPETDLRLKDRVMTLEEYVPHRRENGGVRPCFDLFEYVFNIELPDEVFEDEAFMRVYYAAVDAIGWSNVSRPVQTWMASCSFFFVSGRVLVCRRTI